MNIINKKFSRLLVIEQIESTNKNKKYRCKCDCGSYSDIFYSSLTTGHTKSCGCLQKERTRETHRLKLGQSGLNRLYSRYKQEAKNRRITFNVSIKEFEKITKQKCVYCKSSPNQVSCHSSSTLTEEGKEYSKYIYNGIDRIDNNLGYIVGNMGTCCKQCNIAKGTLSVLDFKNWIIKAYNTLLENKPHGI